MILFDEGRYGPLLPPNRSGSSLIVWKVCWWKTSFKEALIKRNKNGNWNPYISLLYLFNARAGIRVGASPPQTGGWAWTGRGNSAGLTTCLWSVILFIASKYSSLHNDCLIVKASYGHQMFTGGAVVFVQGRPRWPGHFGQAPELCCWICGPGGLALGCRSQADEHH